MYIVQQLPQLFSKNWYQEGDIRSFETRISHPPSTFFFFNPKPEKIPGVFKSDQAHAVKPPHHCKAATSGSSRQNKVMF